MKSQEFCSGELWNLNLTWYTDSPDFTACFHKTVLVYLPCVFLWLFSPFEVRWNFLNSRRLVPWTFLNVAKLVSCSLLVIISVLELITFGILKKDEEAASEVDAANFVGSSVKLATFLLEIGLILSGRRSGLSITFINFHPRVSLKL